MFIFALCPEKRAILSRTELTGKKREAGKWKHFGSKAIIKSYLVSFIMCIIITCQTHFGSNTIIVFIIMAVRPFSISQNVQNTDWHRIVTMQRFHLSDHFVTPTGMSIHLCRCPLVSQAWVQHTALTFQLPAARFCRAPAAPSRVSGLEHSDNSVR